jgi:hypothetical protein
LRLGWFLLVLLVIFVVLLYVEVRVFVRVMEVLGLGWVVLLGRGVVGGLGVSPYHHHHQNQGLVLEVQ